MENGFNGIRKTIASASIEYFIKVGQIIVDCKNKGIKVPTKSVDENWHVSNIRDTIYICNSLGGYVSEIEGKIIAKKLFNTDDILYRDFVEKIYKLLCEEIDGGMEYIPYHLSSNKTFKDLYDYIQNIKPNEFGYVVICDKYAIQIYPAKVRFNICMMSKHDMWIPLLSFRFDLRNNDIIICEIFPDDDTIDDSGQEIELSMLIRDLYLICPARYGFEIQTILLSIL